MVSLVPFQTGRRFRSLSAIRFAACVAATTSMSVVRAQVRFTDVAAVVHLDHSIVYGPPFDFSTDPPNVAATKRVMQRNMGNGAAVGDFDNDGDDDVYLLNQSGFANRLFRMDLVSGRHVFTDVTATAGVGDLGFSRVAHFVDLDNDGWDDLLLINDDVSGGEHPPCKLFRNNGDGTFSDVTTGSGFGPAGIIKGGACLGDYDRDGLLDVYVGLWLMELGTGSPGFPGYNHLFRNLGDFHFVDVTLDAGLGTLQRDSFSCVFADFDNDGDADLYVNVDHTSDAYYRNDDGVFTDQTLAVGATHTGNDMGLSVADFDDDGDLDLYSTNITDADGGFGTTQYNVLLVNQLVETGTMTFVNEAGPGGVGATYWGWGTEFVDVDNDGDLDLYAVNGFDEWVASFRGSNYGLVHTPSVLLINDGSGHFLASSNMGADFVGDSRAAIAFDFNLDGRQDLLVTNIAGPAVLLENRTESAGHWITVKAVGECGVNSNAVGARIHLSVGDTTCMREVIAGGSYLSGRPFEQHFGLGEASTVDRLRVVFPDGAEYSRESLPVDRRYAVFHATATEPARLVVSRDLRDAATFQRCMGSIVGPGSSAECDELDEAGNADGEVGLGDLPAFDHALDWTLPGCASP